MDNYMSIAATSVGLHSMQMNQQMDMAVMKLAMDASTEGMEDLLEAVDVSSLTGIGGNIDIMV